MNKYRVCNGLAIYPDKDMKMLSKMSAKGWHVKSLEGICYRFEEGEPKDYIYNLNMENEVNEDMLSIYKESGWEPIILGEGYQIYRAEAGTTPIFTDNETKIEVLNKQKKSFGMGALIFLLIFLVIVAVSVIFWSNETIKDILLFVALLCWVPLVFTGLPYLGLGKQIKDLKKGEV